MIDIFDDVPVENDLMFQEENLGCDDDGTEDIDGKDGRECFGGLRDGRKKSLNCLEIFSDGFDVFDAGYGGEVFNDSPSQINGMQESFMCQSSDMVNILGCNNFHDINDEKDEIGRTRGNTLDTTGSSSREKSSDDSYTDWNAAFTPETPNLNIIKQKDPSNDKKRLASSQNLYDINNLSNKIDITKFKKLTINKANYNEEFNYKAFINTELSKLSKTYNTHPTSKNPNLIINRPWQYQ